MLIVFFFIIVDGKWKRAWKSGRLEGNRSSVFLAGGFVLKKKWLETIESGPAPSNKGHCLVGPFVSPPQQLYSTFLQGAQLL